MAPNLVLCNALKITHIFYAKVHVNTICVMKTFFKMSAGLNLPESLISCTDPIFQYIKIIKVEYLSIL